MTGVEGEVVGLYFKAVDSKDVIPVNYLTIDKPGIFGDEGRMDIRAAQFDPGEFLESELGPYVERRATTQWAAISFEDLELFAKKKNFGNPLEQVPNFVVNLNRRNIEAGINLCISGMDHLTELPRGTWLYFSNDNPGPVILSVEEHEDIYLDGEKVLRGIAGIVHQTGKIAVGSKVTAEIPQHRIKFNEV